jgi:hypothetical protein
MSPLTTAHAELQIAVARAMARADTVRGRLSALPPSTHPAELHDHRTAVAGDMADALDRIEPGLGTRWMQAAYPEVNLIEVPQ